MLRTGFFTLRRIADFFGLPYDPDPRPDDPISVSRGEFDLLCLELEAAGVPLKPDRDQAWRDFSGWRVNYDVVLVLLCELVMAPPAVWSSDRVVGPRRRVQRPPDDDATTVRVGRPHSGERLSRGPQRHSDAGEAEQEGHRDVPQGRRPTMGFHQDEPTEETGDEPPEVPTDGDARNEEGEHQVDDEQPAEVGAHDRDPADHHPGHGAADEAEGHPARSRRDREGVVRDEERAGRATHQTRDVREGVAQGAERRLQHQRHLVDHEHVHGQVQQAKVQEPAREDPPPLAGFDVDRREPVVALDLADPRREQATAAHQVEQGDAHTDADEDLGHHRGPAGRPAAHGLLGRRLRLAHALDAVRAHAGLDEAVGAGGATAAGAGAAGRPLGVAVTRDWSGRGEAHGDGERNGDAWRSRRGRRGAAGATTLVRASPLCPWP